MENFIAGFCGMAIILVIICLLVGLVYAASQFFGTVGLIVAILFVICLLSGISEWAKT